MLDLFRFLLKSIVIVVKFIKILVGHNFLERIGKDFGNLRILYEILKERLDMETLESPSSQNATLWVRILQVLFLQV